MLVSTRIFAGLRRPFNKYFQFHFSSFFQTALLRSFLRGSVCNACGPLCWVPVCWIIKWGQKRWSLFTAKIRRKKLPWLYDYWSVYLNISLFWTMGCSFTTLEKQSKNIICLPISAYVIWLWIYNVLEVHPLVQIQPFFGEFSQKCAVKSGTKQCILVNF